MARKTSASISARASAARKAAGAGAGAAAGGDGGVYLPGRLTLLALVVLQTASLVLSFGAIAGPIVAQDGTGAGWVRAAERGLLAPLVVQWWYCSRLSAWIEKAAGAGGEVRGMFRQMEAFSLTLFAVPLLAALAGGAAVLLGAPVDRGTAVLGVYVALLALTPAVHILGTPGLHDDKDTHALRTWKLLLSLEAPPHLLPLTPPLIAGCSGAILAAAACALDWNAAWQTHPFPSVVGCFIGIAVGNAVVLYRLFTI